jgi:hypothetical protein
MADRALLIGIGEYRSLPSLPAAGPSVDVLAEVLAGEPVARYQVRALRDISREQLLEEVNGFLSGATSSDRQVLYIACHGVAREEDLYLAAADTERDHIRSTGVPLTFILDSAKGSRAGRVLVILDTCTSGQFPDEPNPKLSSRTKSSRNAVIVSARPRDQYSLRSGRKTVVAEALSDFFDLGRDRGFTSEVADSADFYSYLSNRFTGQGTRGSNTDSISFGLGDGNSVKPSQVSSGSGRGPRPHQVAAVRAIEAAIESEHREIAVEMVQGSGRSWVIAASVYRLIDKRPFGRILYLTDRALLKDQMLYVMTSTRVIDDLTVNDLYPVYAGLHSLESRRGVFISTIQELASFLGASPSADASLFDFIVVDDISAVRRGQGRGRTWKETLSYFEAIKITFSAVHMQESSDESEYLAFRYDLQSALRDGDLVSQPAIVLLAESKNYKPGAAQGGQRVFLGYAPADRGRAREIAEGLGRAGIEVRPTAEGISGSGGSVSEVLAEIRSNDVFVALLSPEWLDGPGASEEFYDALERRGIETISAVIGDYPLPKRFAVRGVVDAKRDTIGLLRRLQASARLNLDSLSHQDFERLVADLLSRLSFRIVNIHVPRLWPL